MPSGPWLQLFGDKGSGFLKKASQQMGPPSTVRFSHLVGADAGEGFPNQVSDLYQDYVAKHKNGRQQKLQHVKCATKSLRFVNCKQEIFNRSRDPMPSPPAGSMPRSMPCTP